ncbi:dicarboxylate/amino acid:cation symporter [Candidatus Aerophobetes bacterium]|uniref:Dicarboxylate/amino acid:cation symporter n=1 Tax=Aerophobetes bacterium TaxID=2030807 RepID=A0A2A4YEG7_UNCAE|nr:MAG: dicarboxylate/amino acid:cation symporter [Candidatus Aerophobetes bacterium]
MKLKLTSSFGNFAALLLGVIASLLPFPFIFQAADHITDVFINFLQLLGPPIIFLSIIATVTNMNSLSEAKVLVRKILKYTLLTTLIAATIGAGLFFFIRPAELSHAHTLIETPTSPIITYLSFVKSIIPSNFAEAFLKDNVLGIAFIATILGVSILQLKETQKELLSSFFQALFQTLLKISTGIIKLLPIGVFFFSVKLGQILQQNASEMHSLLMYTICVISANLIQGFIVLPIILKRKGISPLKLAKAMMPALTTAFFTKSSSATLPLSLQCSKSNFKISEKTANFSFPLCSIINMNGCAAFILITTLFVSASYGVTFSVMQILPWIFISTLAAIGNAGVPMGCYFLTSALLVAMNVPLHVLGMILPLYAFFDMVETCLNVWSDSSITAIVDKEIKESQAEPVQAT